MPAFSLPIVHAVLTVSPASAQAVSTAASALASLFPTCHPLAGAVSWGDLALAALPADGQVSAERLAEAKGMGRRSTILAVGFLLPRAPRWFDAVFL